MNCEENAIKIHRGDDTNWNGENLLNFVVTSETVDLSTMTAKFIVGSIVFDNIPLTTGEFTINFTHQQTASMPWGLNKGVLQILDADKRIKTVTNAINLFVTSEPIVEESQTINVTVPEGSEIQIGLQVGIKYVTYEEFEQTVIQLNSAINEKVSKSGDFMNGPLSFEDFSISSGDGMAKIEGAEYGLRVDTTTGLGASLLTVRGRGDVLTSLDVKSTYSPTGTDPVNGTAVASTISTKQNVITGAATTITDNNLTANKVLISNNSGKVDASSVTSTELGYVSGVTSSIQTQITNEVNARVGGDNNLQGQIDALAASSDVTDIVGTYAELQAYDTSKLKDNDIIKVLSDSTHEGASTYYRWSTHTDTFTYIGLEGPYYTKSEADSEFLSQANAALTYLTQTNAANTYLSQADAASTYVAQSSLESYTAAEVETLWESI